MMRPMPNKKNPLMVHINRNNDAHVYCNVNVSTTSLLDMRLTHIEDHYIDIDFENK